MQKFRTLGKVFVGEKKTQDREEVNALAWTNFFLEDNEIPHTHKMLPEIRPLLISILGPGKFGTESYLRISMLSVRYEFKWV